MKLTEWVKYLFSWRTNTPSDNEYALQLQQIKDTDKLLADTLAATREISTRIINSLETTVKNSEHRWNTLFDSLTDVVIITDETGNIIEFNKAAENILGYNKSEIIGYNISTFIPKNIQSSYTDYLKKIISQVKERHAIDPAYQRDIISHMRDVIIYNKADIPLNFEVSVNLLLAEPDNIVSFIAVMRDCTARKHDEQLIKDREQLLTMVFHTIPDFLLLKDGEGRWQLLNECGKKMYGITQLEFRNRTDAEIALLVPRHAENLLNCTITDEKAWELGTSYQIEERTTDSFGTEYVFDVVKTPMFDELGNRKYLFVHGRNITTEIENNKHIAMLITALNHASDSILVTDYQYKLIYANKTYCDKHKSTLTKLVGKVIDFTEYVDTPSEIIQAKQLLAAGEVWVSHHNNADISITPIKNGKPYPVYFIKVCRYN